MWSGKRMKHIRKKRGLTLKQVANSLGVSISAVSQYERDILTPSVVMIVKIAQALSCMIIDLIDDEDVQAINKELQMFEAAKAELQGGLTNDLPLLEGKEDIQVDVDVVSATFLHAASATMTNGKTLELFFDEKKGKPIIASFEEIYCISHIYEMLNDEGRSRVIAFMEDIAEIPKYKFER